MRDYRDLVIVDLADSEAALIERVAELITERDSYRVVAQRALDAVATVVRERDEAVSLLRMERRSALARRRREQAEREEAA